MRGGRHLRSPARSAMIGPARSAMIGPARSAIIGTALVLGAALGCTAESTDTRPDARALLADAQAALDAAPGVRLELTGTDLPTSGTVLVSATGRAVHPDSFEGEVRLTLAGLAQTVPVVAIGDQVWAKLPLTAGYVSIDPAALGVRSPGRLIATNAGLSDLLTAAEPQGEVVEVRDDDGAVLLEVKLTLPGELVSSVIALNATATDVAAAFAVDDATGELRRAVLTGEFLSGGQQTYTLRITEYGEQPPIRAPV